MPLLTCTYSVFMGILLKEVFINCTPHTQFYILDHLHAGIKGMVFLFYDFTFKVKPRKRNTNKQCRLKCALAQIKESTISDKFT